MARLRVQVMYIAKVHGSTSYSGGVCEGVYRGPISPTFIMICDVPSVLQYYKYILHVYSTSNIYRISTILNHLFLLFSWCLIGVPLFNATHISTTYHAHPSTNAHLIKHNKENDIISKSGQTVKHGR